REAGGLALRIRLYEPQQLLTLVLQLRAVGLRKAPERLHQKRRAAPRPLDLPGARYKTVEQDRGPHAGGLQEHRWLVLVRDQARAVGVGQDQIVVVRDEASRGRRVGVRERTVLHVEQLAPALVAKGAELRAQLLERRLHAGEARPR